MDNDTGMTVDDAITAVAARVIENLVEQWLGGQWEIMPDIGESDWQRVQAEVLDMVNRVDAAHYRAAYDLLESRADPRGPFGEA